MYDYVHHCHIISMGDSFRHDKDRLDSEIFSVVMVHKLL